MYIVTEEDQHFQNFIHNVNTLRERNQLTRRQMADILHITPYMLRLLERGQVSSRLYVDVLFHMRAHFGISFKDMFGRKI